MKKIFAAFLSCLMIFASCFYVPAVLAETANNTITAKKATSSHYSGSIEITGMAVEKDSKYKFSILTKAVKGENLLVRISGTSSWPRTTLLLGKTAENGAQYNPATGELSYTFTAETDKLWLHFTIDKDTAQEWYIAEPKLYKLNESGEEAENIDISFSSDKWFIWTNNDNMSVTDVEVASDFFDGAPANALKSLSAGEYELSPKFHHSIMEYNVTVPHTVDQLDISYETVNGASLKEITGNANFTEGQTNDVKITVNNSDGGETVYLLHVKKQNDPAKVITAMHIYEWAGHDAYLQNTVTVENGKTYTFSVLWKHVGGDGPSFNLQGSAVGSEKRLITVNTAQNGAVYNPATGRLSYTFTAAGDSLTMNVWMGPSGDGMKNFYFAKPELYESNASGEKIEDGAVIDCDPEFTTSWPHCGYGGNYRNVETVDKNFFDGPPSVALTALRVKDYDISPEFYHGIYEYDVTVPHTVDKLDISYEFANGASLDKISGNESFAEGKTNDVQISVNNSEGNITVYTLHVKKEYNPANIFNVMHIGEWNTDAYVEHTVSLQKDKRYTFTFLYKNEKGNDNFIQLYGDAMGGSTKKLIIGDEPQENVDYDLMTGKVTYTFVSRGTELKINAGMSGTQGQKSYYFAQPTLYMSDANGGPISAEAYVDCDPDFENSWPKISYGGNYRKVEVKPRNFFEKTDFPNALTSLDIGYEYSPEFDYRRYTYYVTVPYTVNKLDIKYTLAERATLKEITGNEDFEDEITKNVVISVNDDKNGVTKYTIRVKREAEPTAKLDSLSVGYAMTPAFDPSVYKYTLSVPNSVEALTIEHTESGNSTFKSIVGNKDFRVGIPTDVVITLANSKGIETQYIITVTRQGSGGNTSALESVLKNAVGKLNCDNSTDAGALEKALNSALENGYTAAVADFYRMDAVPGAEDDYGEIVPGLDGYIGAVVNITNGSQLAVLPLTVKIKAPMVRYDFSEDEISKASDFELDNGGKYLVAYTGNAKKIVIPDGVEEIAFGWNQSDYPETAVAMIIPDSVSILPENFAYGMRHLEAVYMGDRITEIPNSSFDRCIFLQYIRLSENLKKIGSNGFSATCSLSHIRLPESLEIIGAKAFYFSMIRNITIPAGVREIGDNAFASPFSAAVQLVEGSDNENFMFIFSSESDEDCVRLCKISDALVDYTDSKGNVYDTYAEAPIVHNWGNDKFFPNGAVYVTPRVVTLLGKNTELGKDVFFTVNGFYSGGIDVRLPNGFYDVQPIRSTITALDERRQNNLDKETDKSIVSDNHLFILNLDMSIAEAAARAQFAADNLIINKDTTAEAVVKALKASYVSSSVLDKIEWKQDFAISNERASGILMLCNDKIGFEIILDVALKSLVTPIDPGHSENNNTLNPIIPNHSVPLKVKGLKLMYIDWENSIVTILKDKTIKQFLDNLVLDDGYVLEFYDNDGYYIPEKFYDVAYLEDDFVIRVKKGYSRVNELLVATSDVIPSTGDSRNIILPTLIALLSLISASGAIALLKHKQK